MRVLIVDDEAPARRKLQRFVAQHTRWEAVGEARSVATAVEAIAEHRPDLVLLDVQLGDGTGFDVLKALPPNDRPQVVFVTAYDEHALEAFDVEAQDYLLKPIDAARFQQCVARLERSHDDSAALDRRLQDVLSRLATPQYLSRLYVEVGERGVFLPVEEIVRIESERNYVRVYAGSTDYRLRKTLADLTAELNPEHFVRINRSTTVNLSHVREVQTWFRGDRLLILSDGAQAKLSSAYLEKSSALRALR